jgi:hypothetical protein
MERTSGKRYKIRLQEPKPSGIFSGPKGVKNLFFSGVKGCRKISVKFKSILGGFYEKSANTSSKPHVKLIFGGWGGPGER